MVVDLDDLGETSIPIMSLDLPKPKQAMMLVDEKTNKYRISI
jgi:hypothetical protein